MHQGGALGVPHALCFFGLLLLAFHYTGLVPAACLVWDAVRQ